MQVQTILKLLGEIQSHWGDISPHPPLPGFGTPVGEKMKQRHTKVEETDLLETISLYTVGLCLWYWYKPKARQQFLLHMRLHFRVKELLVQCSLFVNRSWHQELGFRSYVWSLSHIRSSKIYSTIQHTCKRQRY